MLPSAAETASASQRCEISELKPSRPASLLCTLRTHQSPGEWQHSLPACSLALTGRGFHPLDLLKWFPLLRYWFLHFHAYPSATQRSLTLRPACPPSRLATLCTRGFSNLVASIAALIATGWSEPVPGRVTPAVDHHLSRRTRFPRLPDLNRFLNAAECEVCAN